MKNIEISFILPKNSVENMKKELGSVGVEIIGSSPHCRMSDGELLEEELIEFICDEDKEEIVYSVIREHHPKENFKIRRQVLVNKPR